MTRGAEKKSASIPVTISLGGTVPPTPELTAVIAAPASLRVNQAGTFSAGGSGGSPTSYSWDWGYAGRTATGGRPRSAQRGGEGGEDLIGEGRAAHDEVGQPGVTAVVHDR